MNGLSGAAQDLHVWIGKNGHGTFEGLTNGGHLAYRLTNGERMITSATPSDHRHLTQGKATVRRMLGLRSDSPKAGKYVHRKANGYDGVVSMNEEWEMPPIIDALKLRLSVIDERLPGMNPRRCQAAIRALAEERLEVAAQLTAHGVTPPPLLAVA